jgi:hypothetical protein
MNRQVLGIEMEVGNIVPDHLMRVQEQRDNTRPVGSSCTGFFEWQLQHRPHHIYSTLLTYPHL